MNRTPLVVAAVIGLWMLFGGALFGQQDDSRRQEDRNDYYRKWLQQDVAYIITDAEKDLFKKLSTEDEREQFVEQFWLRRDPDPRTAHNEYKEEHYRRIAYANDHFDSGFAGWKTDRGRVYIVHGPPDEIERNPSGGGYERPFHEGGGATAVVPFERWWYRHIEGLGNDIELEFIDPTYTGEYRMALSADEKDAFLYVPGHGNTLAEQIGMANRTDRLNFSRGGANRQLYPMMQHRAKDSVFARYETFTRIKTPKKIKYPDLKQAVQVDVSYDQLDFEVRQDYFLISDDQFLVPVTIEFLNKDLSYQEKNGTFAAKIALYGVLSTISQRVVAEFEEDLVSSFPADRIEKGRQGRTIFQKMLPLKGHMRYKLTLVAKDIYGAHIGVVDRGLAPPSLKNDGWGASSLVVADYIQRLQGDPEQDPDQMFVLGDMKVRPAVAKAFPYGGSLGLYFQLYRPGIDQSTLSPSLGVVFRILRDGKVLREIEDTKGASALYYSDQRVVVAKGIALKGLEAGRYKVEVVVEDRIRNEILKLTDDFTILGPS